MPERAAGGPGRPARLSHPVRLHPATRFTGIPPTGRPISFVEHVLYRYRDDKIAEIWSVSDMDAIRQQLAPGHPDR